LRLLFVLKTRIYLTKPVFKRCLISSIHRVWLFQKYCDAFVTPKEHLGSIKIGSVYLFSTIFSNMKKTFTALLFLVPLFSFAQKNFTVSGTIKDAKNGEYLIGATVYLPDLKRGATTNEFGFYSLELPQKSVKIQFSFVGYTPQYRTTTGDKDERLDVELGTETELETVVVSANSYREQVQSTQMSVARITAKEAKLIPALLGETDILKALQLKPGVQSGSEGQSGISVRGGQTDQNLFLLDEAVVYNPLHLFGFFSAFNGDAVKDVRLFKGDFPAQYGGRLSSVVDIRTNEGNRKEYSVSGGLGLIASRLTVEGPIKKDKASFIVGARRTYADVFTRLLNEANAGKAGFNPIPDYYFYDLNAGLNVDLTKKDKLFLTAYYGQDRFGFNNNSFNANFDWGNTAVALRWNRVVNPKVFINTSVSLSDYDYNIRNSFGAFSFGVGSGVRDLTAKSDLTYYPSQKHQIRVGVSATQHAFEIGRINFNSTDSLVNFSRGQNLDGTQFGIYINDEWEISKKWKVNMGLRGSAFANDGKFYAAPEPRISARYIVNDDIALKAGYTFMMQYLHLVSNSGASLPTDVWYPSDSRVKPQRMNQIAGGITWNIGDKYLITNELFYKWGFNQVDFKDGARIFANDNLAEEFVFGKAKSYGNEIYLEKKAGVLRGWIGYTLMWSWRQFDSINGGRQFPSRFDRRHDFTFVGIWDITKRWTVSTTMVYSTGNAVTLPVGRTFFQGTSLDRLNVAPIYTDRNAFRFPFYQRLDFNLIYKWMRKNREHDLTLSLYNATNRRNPYFIYYEEVRGDFGLPARFQAKQVSLFPIIPALTWNFKF
jgi:CarboxypepD_reg-like domain/TonB-dependent Receptor Plug Domain